MIYAISVFCLNICSFVTLAAATPPLPSPFSPHPYVCSDLKRCPRPPEDDIHTKELPFAHTSRICFFMAQLLELD